MAQAGTAYVNREARRNFEILETLVCGVVLKGSEVKALRQGLGSLKEGYVVPRDGEIWLLQMHIGAYQNSTQNALDPRRPRKLLVRRRECNKLAASCERKGLTLVPLKAYFDARGLFKIEIGVARGLKKVDVREKIRARDWSRNQNRILKQSKIKA